MSTAVVLPQMGLEVSEGLITAITVAVGDAVAEGDVVCEVETDKAIAEVPATLAGTVIGIDVAVGETIAVGQTILRLGEPGEDGEAVPMAAGATPSAQAAVSSPSAASPPASAPAAPAETPAPAPAGANGSGRRLRAAPIARRAAERLGISLERVTGTGPAGRITLGDVEKAAESGTAPAVASSAPQTAPAATAPAGEGRFEELSSVRAAIARRMSESQLVPQYNLSREIDATWLLAEKARLTAAGPAKVGVVDLLLQALAETLVRHPTLAASFVPASADSPAGLRHPDAIDVGVAVATERGLLVPALRGVQRLGLAELALERNRLVGLAREGRLGLADMGGAATTLSSLGTFGVDSFTAMINPGESSILAVGRTVERAVPRDRGIAVVPALALTMTFDHRVVDGATGAAALAELAELLEGAMEWRP